MLDCRFPGDHAHSRNKQDTSTKRLEKRGGVSNKEAGIARRVAGEDGLPQNVLTIFRFIYFQLPVYKNRVHVVKKIDQMSALEKEAFELRCEQFLQLYARI